MLNFLNRNVEVKTFQSFKSYLWRREHKFLGTTFCISGNAHVKNRLICAIHDLSWHTYHLFLRVRPWRGSKFISAGITPILSQEEHLTSDFIQRILQDTYMN